MNTQLGNDGPAGCKIIHDKVFKEFPRIAKTVQDIERITSEGLKNNYLFDDKD